MVRVTFTTHGIPAMTLPHECTFAEVVVDIGDDEGDGPLRSGMRVLVPCACGETPLDHVSLLELKVSDLGAALLAHDPRRALFHWAPASRRKQITRFGLRPRMRVTTSSGLDDWRAPVICLADSPSWAWALSGEQRHAPSGEWDLWQTELDVITDPVLLPSDGRASGIHEVRTTHRIYKRHLWLVGHRHKP